MFHKQNTVFKFFKKGDDCDCEHNVDLINRVNAIEGLTVENLTSDGKISSFIISTHCVLNLLQNNWSKFCWTSRFCNGLIKPWLAICLFNRQTVCRQVEIFPFSSFSTIAVVLTPSLIRVAICCRLYMVFLSQNRLTVLCFHRATLYLRMLWYILYARIEYIFILLLDSTYV